MNSKALYFSISLIIHFLPLTLHLDIDKNKNYKGRYTRDVREYDIIIPIRVSYTGEFMTHMIPHHYKRSYYQDKTEMGPDDKVHYLVPIKGVNHHVELWPNHNLLAPGMVIETRGSGDKKDTKEKPFQKFMKHLHIRRGRDVQCHYKGRIKGDNDSTIALSTCYGLAGSLRTKQGQFFIEPLVDHDPYSGKEHPHMIYKGGTDKLDGTCGNRGGMFDSLNHRKLHDYQRLRTKIQSRYRRENEVPSTTSSSSSSSAITLTSPATTGTTTAGTATTSVTTDEMSNTTHSGKNKTAKPELNITITPDMPLNVEILLVLDKTLLDYHESIDVENYVLTVMNMAYNLFHDAALGRLINLAIVRIIRLETESDEMNIAVTQDAEKTLNAFCTWQDKVNPGDDCHPNHHDVAVLITRTNICVNDVQCGLLGISKLAGTCDSKLSCCLCQDDGLKLGYVIAHELAHSLGIEHDTPSNGCNGTLPDGLYTVMHPDITMKIEGWSKCSKEYLKVFIDDGYATCLADAPTDHDFPLVDILPGVMYDGDFQCRMMITRTARMCYMGSTCKTLNCALPGYTCLKTWSAPAPGTSCGDHMWCFHHKCEPIGERPDAMDGNWGEWSGWSSCSRSCGSGIAYQERECNNPIPMNGGRDCKGNKRRHKLCSTQLCEIGQPSFRDVQCQAYKNWVFPEDGEVHKWKGQFVRDENPCKLFCKNEEGVVVSMKSTVTDGTSCMRGMRDICVAGKCVEIPCDQDLESNAVEDRCGVCHGDGQGCIVNEGLKHFEMDTSGDLKNVITVPTNTRNVRVREMEPSESLIQVTRENSKDLLTKGNLGMFDVPGSKAWIGMIKGNQESLLIPGPVTEPLVVWIKPNENVSVQYSIAVPSQGNGTPHFNWEFVDWSKCSAHCGPGTQISVPRCIEKEAGLVEDKYCKDVVPKPEDMSRPCEDGPCVPRWFNGDWDECTEVSSSHCEKTRMVNCVRPTGEGEGETDIIPSSECGPPIPQSNKSCPCESIVHKRSIKVDLSTQSFDQNRNPDEDPDQTAMEILGFGKPKKHFYFYPCAEFPYVKRSCKNGTNVSTTEINVFAIHQHDFGSEGESPTGEISRGQTIIDREGLKEVKVEVVLEKDIKGNVIIPPNLANIEISTEKSVNIEGSEALQFLEKVQEQGEQLPESNEETTITTPFHTTASPAKTASTTSIASTVSTGTSSV